MKYLKTYEGLRDQMTPKSHDDIKNDMKHLSAEQKLMRGAREGVFWIMKEALDEGADIHYLDDVALQLIIDEHGTNMEALKYLLKKGANVHAADDYALRFACEYGQIDVIELLLKYSANPHANNDYAIQIAEEDDRNDILDLFKKYGHINESLTTEKRFVVDKKNHKFQLFLENIIVAKSNFNIEQPDELINEKYVGLFKLETNKEFRGKGFMKYLLGQIFEYVKNELNINNILLNVYKNNDSAVKLYFNSGFEIYQDHNDENGEDPYFTLIKKLNDSKINEGIRDKMTPKSEEEIDKTLKDYLPHEILELGYKNQMWNLVKRGIESGANVHMNGNSALRQACSYGNLEIVKYLLVAGADLRAHEDDCLLRACYSGNLELVKYLVDKGADIHAGQIEKILRGACASGHPEIVKYLLDKGADSRKISNSEVTFGENRKEIINLLNKYIKK